MATSAVKIAANRANATQSTGPVDTTRTRFNGLAHGLTSRQTVIPGENQQEYDEFSAGFMDTLKPANTIENVLAERLIAAAWRLQRFTRVETAFLTNRVEAHLEANPESGPDVALANLFVDPAEIARMRLFMRYQTAVQREYDRAYKEFRTVQSERLEQEQGSDPQTRYNTRTSPTDVGFASHDLDMEREIEERLALIARLNAQLDAEEEAEAA